MISNVKFEIEKFGGLNNFGMRQSEVKDILIQWDLNVELGKAKISIDDSLNGRNWISHSPKFF